MDVVYHEEYVRNPRGVQLFTCGWLPASSSPKALVFLCHGYGMECSVFMKGSGFCLDHSQNFELKSAPNNLSASHFHAQKKGHVSSDYQLLQQHVMTLLLNRDYKTVMVERLNETFRTRTLPACGVKLAAAGFGVFGIDYEGHGKSMGARCYIQKFDNLVADCDRFFKSICGMEEYRRKSRFLYGESMGGAVTLLLHRKDPTFWDGAVLAAPMCKISEKVKPHPVVITLLTQVEELIPTWKIVPTKDVIDSAFKDPVKREKIRKNKLIYQDKPRLKTALELLRTSMDVEDSLSEVRMPFFILHGKADTVTDPEVSQALYERAASADKTIKLYPGMWHGLTAGEPDENVELVFADIVAWLNERSQDDRVRAPSEPEMYNRAASSKFTNMDSNSTDSPMSIHSRPRPRRRGVFLCGQCRM